MVSQLPAAGSALHVRHKSPGGTTSEHAVQCITMRRGISLTSATGAAARAVPGGVAGSEAGGPGPDDLGAGGIVYADVIKEIDASGTVTWSWRAAEHLDPALYPCSRTTGASTGR
jgi:hypothetical protein